MDKELIHLRESGYEGIRMSVGVFRCAYDSEFALMLSVQLLAIVLFAGSFFMFYWLNDAGMLGESILKTLGFLFEFVVAMIAYGKGYRYELTKDAFIVTRHGKKQYFYYSEITNVTLEEFKYFKKRRGFIVRIDTAITTVEYRYIFGENRILTGKWDTPFYKLMLNVGLAEDDEPSHRLDLPPDIMYK